MHLLNIDIKLVDKIQICEKFVGYMGKFKYLASRQQYGPKFVSITRANVTSQIKAKIVE